MSAGSGRLPRQAGVVGAAGLALTVAAGVVRSDPALERRLAAVVGWLVEAVFQVSAVLAFLVGLSVIVYSQWNRYRGETAERVHRLTAIGVLAVFVLSLGLTLVLIEDLVAFAGTLFAAVGPDLPPRLSFYAGLAVFGTLTLVGVADACRRRLGSRRA